MVKQPRIVVNAETGCWEWGGANTKGYGRVEIAYKWFFVHRLVWWLFFGHIPRRLEVLHACDNPPCCNPAHLFLGTQDDNVRDMVMKCRQVQGERNGKAKLTADDIRAIRAESGTCTAIAKKWSISIGAVSKIRLRTSWSHID